MKQKPDIIIAIDPDVERSGVATLAIEERKLGTFSLTFPELMDALQLFLPDKTLVVVEAGWLNKPNWHLTAKDSARLAAAKGNSTGRNHETGRKIVEMAKHYGLKVDEVKPLRKCWRGKDGKITHEELEYMLEKKKINGFPKKSNQDMRDSTLLCLIFSGL